MKRWVLVAAAAIVAAFSTIDCVGDSGGAVDAGPDADLTGTISHPCYANGTCNPGLTCISNVCVQLDSGGDAQPSDGSPSDVSTTDASDASAATYTALADGSAWVGFDLAAALGTTARGFRGAVFDGRWVYYVPSDNLTGGTTSGVVARYDTTSNAFATAGSWQTYDIAANVSASLRGFRGGVFDGKKYVYFVGYSDAYGVLDSVFVRYDKTQSFTAATSWVTFDAATALSNSALKGYSGATFDGRYVYFVPVGQQGNVLSFDTNASSFTQVSAWQQYDLTQSNANAKNFDGAVFDGKYVYLVPQSNPAILARRDVSQALLSAGWEFYDLTNVDPTNAYGFHGAAFDGESVYLVPWYTTALSGLLVQYHTKATFTSAGSYEKFDVSTLTGNPKGFQGAAFDGQYVYLEPYGNNAGSGVVARFDATHLHVTDTSGWSTFDLVANVNANAKGFFGAVFDGEYLYFAPNGNSSSGYTVRFDARKPPGQAPLPAFYGSFF